MKIESDAQLVTVFLNSTDQWHGQSLYTAIVQLCKDRGIAGVTVLRGVEGFGGSGHIHTSRLLELSENLPVQIDIVDIAERIEPLLSGVGRDDHRGAGHRHECASQTLLGRPSSIDLCTGTATTASTLSVPIDESRQPERRSVVQPRLVARIVVAHGIGPLGVLPRARLGD